MPELLVMRHAKSDWNSPAATDFDRPLNDRGQAAAQKMAEWLDQHDLEPDHIISSSAVRARDTATVVARHFSMEDRLELRDELYLAASHEFLDVLQVQTSARVLVCGHNPGIDDFVEMLGEQPLDLTEDGKLMTTAAIAHFELSVGWPSISEGVGRLLTLVRPREL